MQKSRGSFKLKRLGICLLLGGKGSYHRGLSILIESVASNLFMGIAKFFLKRSRILGTHQLTFDYPCSEFKKAPILQSLWFKFDIFQTNTFITN